MTKEHVSEIQEAIDATHGISAIINKYLDVGINANVRMNFSYFLDEKQIPKLIDSHKLTHWLNFDLRKSKGQLKLARQSNIHNRGHYLEAYLRSRNRYDHVKNLMNSHHSYDQVLYKYYSNGVYRPVNSQDFGILESEIMEYLTTSDLSRVIYGVKWLLKHKSITDSALADKVGTTQQTINNLKRGKQNLNRVSFGLITTLYDYYVNLIDMDCNEIGDKK